MNRLSKGTFLSVFTLALLFPAVIGAEVLRCYTGTCTFTIPDATQIKVAGAGGGGGGAGGSFDTNASSPGSGGGGGAEAVVDRIITIPANATLKIDVGRGGPGGTGNWNGGAGSGTGRTGGDTRLYANDKLILTLKGGRGGNEWGSPGTAGGPGGQNGGGGERACGGTGGKGGDSLFGSGGAGVPSPGGAAVRGNDASGHGAGGSGGGSACEASAEGAHGGDGTGGFLAIYDVSEEFEVPPPPPPPPPPAAQCVPLNICGSNDTHVVNSCTGGLVEDCTLRGAGWACNLGRCALLPMTFLSFTATTAGGNTLSMDGHLRAVPTLVRRDERTRLYWNVQNALSCAVKGSNGDGGVGDTTGAWSSSFSGASGQETSALNAETIYTLTCIAHPGVQPERIVESTRVNVAPIFNEQ